MRKRVSEYFSDLVPESRSTPVGLWTRRAVLALFAVIVALALLDRFGQGTSESAAPGPAGTPRGPGPAGTLRVLAPEIARGGLLFQSRIEIRARLDIELPRVVLDRGWLEGMQI